MPKGTRYKYKDYHKEVNGILYKKCTLHNTFFLKEDEWLPCTDEFFYKNNKNKQDGLHPECKKCSVQKSMKYNIEHPEQRKINKNKWNAKYENVLIRRWYEERKRERGYYEDYYKKYPEKLKEQNKKRKNKNHNITKSEWNTCKEYFDNSCAYCGLLQKDHWVMRKGKLINMDLHKEHVDHEGKNDLSNCVPACQTCNDRKWKFTLEEWCNENNPRFTKDRYNKIIQWINEDYKLFN